VDPAKAAQLLIALALSLAALAHPAAQIRYDAVDPSHLAKIATSVCILEKSLKTLPPQVVESPMGTWKAVVQQTDPVVVPYDQAKGCIQVGGGPVNRSIMIGNFRTLEVTWINERLLYVFTDVGHTAGVGQLLDVYDGKWIYARTEYYLDAAAQTGPPSPRQPDAVVIQAAKRSNVHDIDPKLPTMTFEVWLRSVAGTQPTMKWGVTDCGEQSGNPAVDRGRDLPMCAEVIVSLSETRELVLDVAMGTFAKGLTGGKPVLYVGALKTGDKLQWIKTLSEVPVVLVGR
jgi:hypothetical protein